MSFWRAGLHVIDGVAAVVAVGIAVNQVLNDSKWNWWALVIAIGICGASVLLRLWLDRRTSLEPPVAATETVRSAAQALARMAADQWENEAELRSLNDPDPMPVRWLLTEDPGMADAAGQAAAAGWDATSAAVEELAVQFRALPRGRLVVLGGPGSGKTTLAVQLLRELIRTREQDEPVPVLLSAASWDTATHRGVWEWMAAQLALTYPALKAAAYGPDACRDLVAGPDPLVLPVIDGLDEIPPTARAAVLKALNRSLGRGRLILTCRTDDWADTVEAADTAVGGAAVIVPSPLTPTAAAHYLRRCLQLAPSPAWQHLLDHLTAQGDSPGSPLAEVCTTPLGLWLVRTVYQPPAADASSPDPAPLTDPAVHPTADALRAHLLDRLVPALVDQRPPSRDPRHLFRPRRLHDPDDATRWLVWIARHLTHPRTPEGEPRTRDLAWWRLARHTLTPTRLRTTAALVIGLSAGAAVVPTFGLRAGLGAVLAAGTMIGFRNGFGFSNWLRDQPGYANLTLHRRKKDLVEKLLVRTTFGLLVGLLFGLTVRLAFWTVEELTLRLTIGLGIMSGLSIGIALGLIAWAESSAPADQVISPVRALHADRALAFLRLLLGLAIGLGSGLAVRSAFGVEAGIPLGLWTGFVCGLISGRHHAWWCYLLATGHLSRRGVLPRDVMGFLDDAHRLGLLRAVGPVYQFRHADFQDHLALDAHTDATNSPISTRH